MLTCKSLKFNLVGSSSQFTYISSTRHVNSFNLGYLWRHNNFTVFSLNNNRWNHANNHGYSPKKSESNNSSKKQRKRAQLDDAGDYERAEEGERNVRCEVEVISWRERRIRSEIDVCADVDSVWIALTDYEHLADFVPNLVYSGIIPCPHPGRIWVEQRGFQRALYWHIEARVVLDLQEFPISDYHRELRFSMVDGDFKKFEGKWSVKCGIRSSSTLLSYEVSVIPRFNFPAIFLERIIRSDLPVNLRALACRAERKFSGNQEITVNENSLGRTSMATSSSLQVKLDSSVTESDNLSSGELKEGSISSFGSVTPSASESNKKWGVYGKVCKLDRHSVVDEVHLRRFDGLLENGGVHRCVVASITVKAPVSEVWNVLTDYKRLPEIVPNLAISRILSRENNRVRILQEGCKGLLYMVLHARVVLDLCELHEQEISFEQVEGDFDSFQGKWILEQLGSHHTLLKYNVESKMHKDTFLSEAIMEEVIYEDLPSNLCAIRDYVEKGEEGHSLYVSEENLYMDEPNVSSDFDSDEDYGREVDQFAETSCQNSTRQRPRVPGLQRDIEILKAELLKFISEHGQEGFMPMRKQLRQHGRVDIEKAITRMGGFRRIASLMNLSLSYKHRKPKGYWDNLENLQEEISRFQKSWGMDASFMPSRKSFERAGRFDIARALERWGGLHEVSRLLSLQVRHPNRAKHAKEKKIDYVVSNHVEEKNGTATNPCVSQDTQKWLLQLKHLDINWVE